VPVATFAIALVLTLAVHGPALHHAARGDQLFQLAEMSEAEDWFTLAVRKYAFNRERELGAGDELLFRPLCYFVIGTEKWLFGYDFRWWQAVGVAAHLCVVWVLARLLWQLHSGFASIVAVLLFSTMYLAMEMVVFNHFHFHLLFVLAQLAATTEALRLLRWSDRSDAPGGRGGASGAVPDAPGERGGASGAVPDAPPLARIVTMTGWMAIACFSVDVGPLLCLWTTLVLIATAKPGCRRRYVACALPAVLYFTLSAWDLARRPASRQGTEENRLIVSGMRVTRTAGNALASAVWWMAAGLVGPTLDVYVGERLSLGHPGIFDPRPRFARPGIALLLPAAVALTVAYVMRLRLACRTGHVRSRLRELVLLAGLPAAWALLVAAGREHSRGLEASLAGNLHYTYSFWALVLPLLLAAIVPGRGSPGPGRGLLFALAGLWIIVNGRAIQTTNIDLARYCEPRALLARQVENFIEQHRHEPGFSIFVMLSHPYNFGAPFLARRGDPPGMCSFAWALFRPHSRVPDPRYMVLGPHLIIRREPHWLVRPPVE
jgi:hypothetical protein